MRIALIRPAEGPVAASADLRVLASGLGELGHAAVIVDGPPVRLRQALRGPEAILAGRGFTGSLTHAPAVAAALLARRFDVVHAFSVVDALAARWWRARSGRAVAFTLAETLDRANVAHARLRLRLLDAALADAGTLRAVDAEVAAALRRWMAIEAPVLPIADAQGAVRAYELATAGERHGRGRG